MGLALLLRQVWVGLTWQLARGRRLTDWIGELPLRRLLDRLAVVLQRKYPEEKVIDLEHSLLYPEGLLL